MFGEDRFLPRVLIVSQVYKPSHDAISQLLAELAEGLVRRNISVHVLTSATNYMTGSKLSLSDVLSGVKIWRTPSPPLSKQTSLGRIVLYGSFATQSAAIFALLPRFDVVLILSTPPLLAWTSLLYKYYKTKSVFVAQDVYPELPIRMGYLKNRFVRTILSSFDKATLSRFSSVVVLGERMRDEIVKKGYPKERIEIIENWQAGPEIKPIEDGTNPFVAKHGLEGSFVVQYSGNMGVAHNLSTILEAAKLLKFNPQIKFVFIGDGKRRQEVESTVKAENLPNVLLFPYQPLERLPETLTSAHLHLVSLRPELEGLAAPSKLYGILAAGKPVLFIGDVDGEIGRIVRRGECGFTVQNGADLAERILKLRDNELLRAKMGGNARIIYEREFTRERALDKYELLIRRLYADKVTHSG